MNTAGATGEVKIGKDILSPPAGYGTRTLMGPEGAIQLNNKDTVIAGTNLFDKSSTDNSALEKAMLSVGNMIVDAINKQRSLDLSGYYS
jgi:hypothetical protein